MLKPLALFYCDLDLTALGGEHHSDAWQTFSYDDSRSVLYGQLTEERRRQRVPYMDSWQHTFTNVSWAGSLSCQICKTGLHTSICTIKGFDGQINREKTVPQEACHMLIGQQHVCEQWLCAALQLDSICIGEDAANLVAGWLQNYCEFGTLVFILP